MVEARGAEGGVVDTTRLSTIAETHRKRDSTLFIYDPCLSMEQSLRVDEPSM